MTKTAAPEDGPSFEQQFGILTNAKIVEKYPKLDAMKLAFQLIDKNEDDNKAVGACVYLVGGTVIFIPSFYRNGDITTGDMMFIAQTQQFLPLSDPWLAWVQNKELQQPGQMVPESVIGDASDVNATTIKDTTDPIIKTASVYLRGLIRAKGGFTDNGKGMDIFDMALGMGKTAAETMLDNLIGSKDFLNAALHFYRADKLDGFAKKAALLGRPQEVVKVILPFTKEAKELDAKETEILHRDGYIIKRASALVGDEHMPAVIRSKHVRDTFRTVNQPGKFELMKMDGSSQTCLVMRKASLAFSRPESELVPMYEKAIRSYGDPGTTADWYMHEHGDVGLCAIVTADAEAPIELASTTIRLATGESEDFKPEMLEKYGVAATPQNGDLKWGTWVLCPDGVAYEVDSSAFARSDGWMSTKDRVIAVGSDDKQKSPICSMTTIILPPKSRMLEKADRNWDKEPETYEKDEVKGKHSFPFVTWESYETFMNNYVSRNYKKVKVTTNGNEMYITDEKSNGAPMSVKEASLHIVNEYGVEPGVVRNMFTELNAGAGTWSAKSETYLISKTAAVPGEDGWQNADIPNHNFTNIGDQREYRQMPTVLESPEQLQKAVVMAAENGIKDVFDVTAFKLMIRQNRFLEEINQDLPKFMQVLDSLCRKLFLLYCHTDEFEERYGTVKLKSIEESLKDTLDSLSELTVFFKMRSVDTGEGIGQDGGDLMRGYDM